MNILWSLCLIAFVLNHFNEALPLRHIKRNNSSMELNHNDISKDFVLIHNSKDNRKAKDNDTMMELACETSKDNQNLKDNGNPQTFIYNLGLFSDFPFEFMKRESNVAKGNSKNSHFALITNHNEVNSQNNNNELSALEISNPIGMSKLLGTHIVRPLTSDAWKSLLSFDHIKSYADMLVDNDKTEPIFHIEILTFCVLLCLCSGLSIQKLC
uniref:Uncharacterized protein n=1 Tax=Stomoxys calcitrans TaxID=35570 RepID=A0A1I8Q4W9_STOCA